MSLLIALGQALIVTLALGSPMIAFYLYIREIEKKKKAFWDDYYRKRGKQDD